MISGQLENNTSNDLRTNLGADGVIDVSLPPNEWFDEMFGPPVFVLSDVDKKNESNGNPARKNKVRQIKTPQIKTEIIDLSDDEGKNQPVDLIDESCDTTGQESIDTLSHQDIAIDNEIYSLETTSEANVIEAERFNMTEELKKIVLTKTRLNVLSEAATDSFHKAVIGCFVRVHVPGIAEQFKDLLFFDQIENVFEPMSFQHFWFNRRFRLVNFGDFEIENIFDEEVNDTDIRRWFAYVEAKDGILPAIEFIKQKETDLFSTLQKIKENPVRQNKIPISPSKIKIKKGNLEKITLGIDTLRNLAKMDFERFRSTVKGCFVCIQAIRRDKPSNCQYHICPIMNCVRSEKNYKLRNIGFVDFQIVLPYYGKYNLNWLRDDFSIVTEEGFRVWIEDMNFWNEEIPTLDQISNKAALLQLTLTEAEVMVNEKDASSLNEKQKKMPVQTASDLDGCLLTHQRLKKLSILYDQIEFLDSTMNGCFVRMKIGPTKQFRIDQVKRVELMEIKEEKDNDDISNNNNTNEEKKKELVLHFNSFGTITINNLFKTASQFKIEEQEFREWLRIMHRNFNSLLPTKEFVERKQQAIERALKLAMDKQEQEDMEGKLIRSNGVSRVSRPFSKSSRNFKSSTHHKSTLEQIPVHRPRSAGPSFRRGKQLSGYRAYQSYSTRPVVRTTPGVLPGWTPRIVSSTDLYNRESDMINSLRQQQQSDNFSHLDNRSQQQYLSSSLSNNSLLGKRSMVFDDKNHRMLDLWKINLQNTEKSQREQQLNDLMYDEHTSDFNIPFVRGGTILDDRSFETELRSTQNFYSLSPVQSSFSQFDSSGPFASGSRGIDRYQSNSSTLLNNLGGEQLFSNSSTSSAARNVSEFLSLYDPYNNNTSMAAKRSRPFSPVAPPVQRFF